MEENTTSNQCKRILSFLIEHGSITPNDAEEKFGCRRLASRISDLRRKGVAISVKMEYGKNRFGEKTHWARYYYSNN